MGAGKHRGNAHGTPALRLTDGGTLLVPASMHSRLEWARRNRSKVATEQRLKEEHEQARQAEQHELCKRVGLARSASAGRVAASREQLLHQKQSQRREEAVQQRHALAEKQRRMEELREEHAKVLAGKYRPIAPAGVDPWLRSLVSGRGGVTLM